MDTHLVLTSESLNRKSDTSLCRYIQPDFIFATANLSIREATSASISRFFNEYAVKYESISLNIRPFAGSCGYIL